MKPSSSSLVSSSWSSNPFPSLALLDPGPGTLVLTLSFPFLDPGFADVGRLEIVNRYYTNIFVNWQFFGNLLGSI